MKATSALLALGVCLAMAAPSARADDSKIYVDWKFGNRRDFPSTTGYVWNGAFQDAVVAAMEAGDYAAFQALTNGFNESVSTGNKKYFKTGAADTIPAFAGSFTNAQDFITFLYFSQNWDGNNSPTYHIFEKSTEGKRYGPPDTWYFQVNAVENKDSFTSGTVGQSAIATDPAGLPLDGFDPAALDSGLSVGGVVTCAAPAEIVYESAHYTNLDQVAVQTWDKTVTPHAWSAPVTNDAPGGKYVYTKGEAPAKITWLYKRDGWQLALPVDPPNSGTVTPDPVPNLGPDPSFACYADDTQVALTAVPATAGFVFRCWLEGTNDLDTSGTHTVTMDQPRTVRAVFESIPLTWNGGVDNVWTNGGAGWLDADGNETNWSNGARAVFTNGASVTAEIAAEGVTATAVRFEGAAVNLTGGALTMINDAAITATNPGVAVAIDAPIAGTDGLTVSANAAEKSFVIGKPATFTGDLAIQSGRVEFGEEGRLGVNGTFAGAVTLAAGTVLATPPCKQTFSGQVSGAGKVLVQGKDVAWTRDAAYTGFLPPNKDTVIATVTNATLKYLTAAGGRTAGHGFNWANQEKPFTHTVIDRKEDGSVSVHLQIYGNDKYTEGVEISCKEEDGTITAKPVKAYYWNKKNLNIAGTLPPSNPEYNFIEYALATATNSLNAYGVQDLQLAFRSGYAEASFADAQWTGGLTVGTNGFVEAKADKGLPNEGTVKAVDGGELKLSCQGPGIWGGKANAIHVHTNGVMTIAGTHAVRGGWNTTRNVYLVNGIIDSAISEKNEIYYLDVLNGGRVTGNPIQLSDLGDKQNMMMSVKVHGDACFRQEAGYFYGSSLQMDFKMDVENIGDDPELDDMIVSGPITGNAYYTDKKHPENNGPKSMIKAGAGTVVFSGANDYSNCITRIDEGTLRFETDHAMGIGTNTDTRIVLNGDGAEGKICVLDIGTNANKVCALGLEQKGGTLKLGEGGTIEFAASGALDWAEGAELMIKGAFGPRTVRFGTDKNGLMPEQLKKIKLADWLGISLHLDADGWLCGNPPGTVISIIR